MDMNPTTYSWLMYHWWAKAEPNESQIQQPNLQVTSGQETPQLQDQPLIVQKTWVLRHPLPSKAFPDNNTDWLSFSLYSRISWQTLQAADLYLIHDLPALSHLKELQI